MIRKFIFNTSEVLKKLGININDGKHPAVLEMQRSMIQAGGITFKFEFYPDGSWAAESTNFDGIITGGKNSKEINFTLKDAIFTYFGVPPQNCNDKLLIAANEPVFVEQRVLVTR